MTCKLRYERLRLTFQRQTSVATIAVTYFILTLLVGIVLFAYPKNRSVHHDAFERTHRFLGWSATALVWVQVRTTRCYTTIMLTDSVILDRTVDQ